MWPWECGRVGRADGGRPDPQAGFDGREAKAGIACVLGLAEAAAGAGVGVFVVGGRG